MAQEQKKKEKADRKLEKDKAKEQKRKPIDPNSITLGGPVLVKATNEIINKASERKIPEGWLMHLVNEGNLGEIQRTKYPREELDYQTKYGQVKENIHYKNWIDVNHFFSQTPLHVCCQDGRGPNSGYDIAKALVAMGANVNATDSSGWTPLHAACKSFKSPELVVLLGTKAPNEILIKLSNYLLYTNSMCLW